MAANATSDIATNKLFFDARPFQVLLKNTLALTPVQLIPSTEVKTVLVSGVELILILLGITTNIPLS